MKSVLLGEMGDVIMGLMRDPFKSGEDLWVASHSDAVRRQEGRGSYEID